MPRTAPDFREELAQRLNKYPNKQLEPTGVAQLMRLAVSANPLAPTLLRTLHENLLVRTATWARTASPYYRAREIYSLGLNGRWIESGDLPWPILGRQEVVEALADIVVPTEHAHIISHTSGTTGPALDVYRSSVETKFLSDYYRALQGSDWLGSKPLILTLPNAYHGTPVPLPSIGQVVAGAVIDNGSLRDTAQLLMRRYHVPGHEDRISIITGLAFHVEFLTSYLRSIEFDTRGMNLKGVVVTGGYLAPHQRHVLEEAWGAPVHDRFTLTEAVGGAMRCACGYFHMDPHIYGEVVDVDTNQPIEQGVGKLVLTPLYPFSQMQPLIRYDTGDLVCRAETDHASGLTFTFLGKAKHCRAIQSGGRTDWVLFSAEVHDILTSLPDVRLSEPFANVTIAADRSVGGLPLYAATIADSLLERPSVSLVIELRYAPTYFPGRTEQLKAEIEGALSGGQAARVGKSLRDRTVGVKVRFVGPGSLNHTQIKV